MGLEAIYPKSRLCAGGRDHRVYPYLLKGITNDRPGQVWRADITHIRLAYGFAFLVVFLD